MRKICKSTVKICATCNYWQGKIKLYSNDKGLERYRILDREARCCHPDRINNNFPKENDSYCVRYLPRFRSKSK